MRGLRTFLLFAAAIAFAGCDEDDGFTTPPNVPLAYTRFVNAVPDTGAQDWRFVDILENSPPAFALTFRQFTPYQGTAAGTHTLRVFPTSSDISVTSQRLIDTELTFEAGRYYTIVHTGYARAGSTPENHIVLIQDDIPASIAANQYAIRAMHMGTGLGAVDVYAATSTSAPLPGTPLFTNVPYETTTAYATLDTGAVALRALATGSVTPALANAAAPAGVAGNPSANLTTIGGSRMGGSAIVGIFMPASVTGSAAPQSSAFQSPAWVYIIDKHPR